MCVDLRPLNSRILKQKYPFPNIEDCISRLYNKSVFTLLDLKDSFHQIRVNADSTKYFSFATAEGQFEYNYLPFGYSEAPAEFQKRILQILNPSVRQEKLIVYMDDILGATTAAAAAVAAAVIIVIVIVTNINSKISRSSKIRRDMYLFIY